MLIAPAMRAATDIEKLLVWAYRDELAKRWTSSAEAVWNKLEERAIGAAYDLSAAGPQRYDVGVPDPDAERVELAVAKLPDLEIDWQADAYNILGNTAALLKITGPLLSPPATQRTSYASWRSKSGDKQRVALEAPRQAMLVRSLRTSALVVMHAHLGSRPNWYSEQARPHPTPAIRGPGVKIVGECKGRLRYSNGSYCPLRWEPSPISIAEARADYLAWHYGLEQLTTKLDLEKFRVTGPAAPQMPWAGNMLAF